MKEISTDRIDKELQLNAPASRVWRALSDSAEFGAWFGVDLEGPFQVGEIIRGQITHPGCEQMIFEARVEQMAVDSYFAFRWHPHTIEAGVDRWTLPSTLVEFRLEASGAGTLLRISESGFDGIAEEHREISFTRNEGGWIQQVDSIKKHVDG